jgi:uncharacterized protein YbcI
LSETSRPAKSCDSVGSFSVSNSYQAPLDLFSNLAAPPPPGPDQLAICARLVASVSVSGSWSRCVSRPGGSPSFPLPAPDFSDPGKGEIGRLIADRTEQEQPAAATLHAAIAHAIVGLLREYTGRGPTKSRTTIRDNIVLVMLEQTLTKGEQSLVNKGRSDKVIEIRHEFQEAMREESMAKVGELTADRSSRC